MWSACGTPEATPTTGWLASKKIRNAKLESAQRQISGPSWLFTRFLTTQMYKSAYKPCCLRYA